MLTAFVAYLVDLSRRLAWMIITLTIIGTGLLGWYVATHFKINTDINQLISHDLPWKQREAEIDKAFPQKSDLLVIVIDGATADAAENGAAALADKLKALPKQFSFVERPDAIPFFRKNGLLFLSQDELQKTLGGIVEAQPFFSMLSTDPSLRGFFGTLGLMAQGVQQGAVDYSRLDQPFDKIAGTVEAAAAGQDKPLEWQSMAPDKKAGLRELRKFILVKPVLDYTALQPGEAASTTVRKLANELQLTSDKGVTVRLTGPVALNDDEFASVANGTGFATILSGALVFILLLMAMKSLRIVLPIIATLVAGLVATTAFALAAIGSLNLISVAFAVMFIGIAVDFGIQFGIRYRDQHYHDPDHAKAMQGTAHVIAIPLSMAAGSTALGFMAFIPTAYRGVSELGLIAGAGMLIAFFLNITLLPALMTLTRPKAERELVGYTCAAPIDAFLVNHRKKILVVALFIGFAGAIIAAQLHFDFDPLNLKDPKTESVSTLLDMMKDPDAGTYNVEILRPSIGDAQQLADKLSTLSSVDHVMTLASFIPTDQDAKLQAIQETKMVLDPALSLPALPPPDSDTEFDSAKKLAATMHELGGAHPSALRLANAIDKIVDQHDTESLARLKSNLIATMAGKLEIVKQLLNAEAVTLDNITPDLRKDWVTTDGRALIQVVPKGNPRNHDTLVAFTQQVRELVPDASGAPVSIQESGHTITHAFIHAGIYAIIAISLLAFLILRRVRDVLMLMTPLILAGILTLATIVIIGLPLNFANIIALPLLLSLGVSYAIYFVSYWRSGASCPLQSSMARAVLFSAATVLVAFGSLALSSHPGTAGMGELLTVSLLYSLLCTFFVLPPLLGSPTSDKY